MATPATPTDSQPSLATSTPSEQTTSPTPSQIQPVDSTPTVTVQQAPVITDTTPTDVLTNTKTVKSSASVNQTFPILDSDTKASAIPDVVSNAPDVVVVTETDIPVIQSDSPVHVVNYSAI